MKITAVVAVSIVLMNCHVLDAAKDPDEAHFVARRQTEPNPLLSLFAQVLPLITGALSQGSTATPTTLKPPIIAQPSLFPGQSTGNVFGQLLGALTSGLLAPGSPLFETINGFTSGIPRAICGSAPSTVGGPIIGFPFFG